MRKIVYLVFIASHMLVAGGEAPECIQATIEYVGGKLIYLNLLDSSVEARQLFKKETGKLPSKIGNKLIEEFMDLIDRFKSSKSDATAVQQFNDETKNIFVRIPVMIEVAHKLELAYPIPQQDGTYKLKLLNPRS